MTLSFEEGQAPVSLGWCKAKVFTRKAKDWQGTKWAEYLRPSTLLGRFEEYHSAPTSGSLPGGAEVHRAQGTTTGPNGGATDEAVKAVKGVW